MDDQTIKENSNSRDNSFDKVLEQLITVQTRLALCAEEIPRAILDSSIDKDIDKVRGGFNELYNNMHSLVETLIKAKNEDDARIILLEAKYGELLFKFQKESQKVNESEKENQSLMLQISKQHDFCTNFGAISGHLLWRSSKYPQIINSWLTQNQPRVSEFLSIANGTFVSFVELFRDSFPPLKNDESQFVMALLGTITNISCTPGGRKFIANDNSGKKLLAELVKLLPMLPIDTADSIKRLVLKVLYNVSMNCDGLPYLFDLKIEESLINCFDDSTPVETLVIALRLIQSITYDLVNPRILQRLLDILPITKIQSLAESNDQKLSVSAQGVVINIKNCQGNADTMSNVSSQITLTNE